MFVMIVKKEQMIHNSLGWILRENYGLKTNISLLEEISYK